MLSCGPVPPSMSFPRRPISDRVLIPTAAAGNADMRSRITSAPVTPPVALPGHSNDTPTHSHGSSMRGMRRLEMRRGMEESHYLAQKARTSTLNPPVDMRLLDYVSDYDGNLMCAICRCPFVDPVVLHDCDHCFCRDCLSQAWTEYHPGGPRGDCPTCRRAARLGPKTAVSKILVNILDELVVKCPKHDDGCTAEIKRGQVHDHIALYCGYALVECPRLDCEQATRRKDANECLHYGASCIDCHETMFVDNLENHWRRECADRKFTCPLCGDIIFYRTLDMHTRETCPAITTPCPGSPYGCNFRSRRGELETHSHACMFAMLAPVFAAQQKKIDEQHEMHSLALRKLAVLEQGFSQLETLVRENSAPDLTEPSNPADPEHIPLAYEPRVRSSRRDIQPDSDTDTDTIHYTSAEGPLDRRASSGSAIAQHTREHSMVSSVLPNIDFPAPPAGHASTMGHTLSTISLRMPTTAARHSHYPVEQNDYLTPYSQEASYAQSSASPTQHLLSLHESLRDEVTRIAGALHELDGRHSMLMLNENLRLKEDMAFLNAQVSGLGRQVGWLTSATVSRGNGASSMVGHGSQSIGEGRLESRDDACRDRDNDAGDDMGPSSTAIRGSARMVNLSRSIPTSGTGAPRRIGSDEGRTKL